MKIKATTQVDRVKLLGDLRGRSRLLTGAVGLQVAAFCAAAYDQAINTDKREEAAKRMHDLCAAAASGDREAMGQLQAIRIETVNNFVLASSNAISFFELVNLADDEVPYIQNETRHEIDIKYLGEDGRSKRTQGALAKSQSRVDLRTLSTPEYEYPLRDIYHGDVRSDALALVDVTRDFDQQIDTILWPYIKGQAGAFGLTGAKQNRVYVPHSAVIAANLPTTNVLTPDDNSGSTLWRQKCMNVVIKYCAQWGSNAFVDGGIAPVAVYVPSLHVTGWLEQVQLVSTNTNNTKTEEIFENGYLVSYGGHSWTLVGDSTLDPALGAAWVKTNKGIGTFYTKPGMDQVFVDDSVAMKKQNLESMSMSKVIGVGLPTHRKVNLMKVQYRTA